MNSGSWRLSSYENSSVKRLSNYSLGLLQFVNHKWKISVFVARTKFWVTKFWICKVSQWSDYNNRPIMIWLSMDFALNKDVLNMLNISLFITLNKTARLLKLKQIWKNRLITKARLNGLENSQANLRCYACFNIVLLIVKLF